MKKNILLILSNLCFFYGMSQDVLKNSITTSVMRLEKNSQTIYGEYQLKLLTSIEYQRHINRWGVSARYEHGFNKIDENPTKCFDCFYGTGLLRENNFFLSVKYELYQLFNSKLQFNTGIGIYYSNLNYSGFFQGGYSGSGMRKNSTYNTIGLSPNFLIKFHPKERFFIGVNTSFRYGWSHAYNAVYEQNFKIDEIAIIAPELKIGVAF
jgi:hypothetical protein